MLKFSIFIFCFFLYHIVAEDGHCIWYDQCGRNSKGKLTNCEYNGTAKLLTDEIALQTLETACGMVYNGQNDTYTCCSSEQIATMADQFGMAKLMLGRCPSCYYNFRSLFCAMTCAANQSNYLSVVETGTSEKYPGRITVESINYTVADDFAQRILDSCRDVLYPGGNQHSLDTMCGRPYDKCTKESFMQYLGVDNPAVPFPIYILFQNDTTKSETYFNQTTFLCNEPLITQYENKTACGCLDCLKSCRPLPPDVPEKKFLIFNMDGWVVIAVICTVFLLIVFHGTMVILPTFRKRPTIIIEQPTEETSLLRVTVRTKKTGCLISIRRRTEQYLERIFFRLGLFCAQHPFIVLLTGTIVIAGLSSGLIKFQVTTDPVQLWSAKSSIARQQKDYFDKHFKPFYRTTQLIIVPDDQTFETFDYLSPPAPYAEYTFGPVFKLDFLSRVLDLQTKVLSLTADVHEKNRTVHLSDICFKPLEPDNENCTVFSILQYFQNSRENLYKRIGDDFFTWFDYTTHFISCSQAPTTTNDSLGLSCFGDFGGTINPFMVLGNYSDAAYANATALVITLVIENSNDPEKVQLAEAWEKVFLSFMKNFTEEQKSLRAAGEWNKTANFTVYYSAERSIEDELNRQSQSDILTIGISYTIMFLYVTLTLGHIRSWRTCLIDLKISVGFIGVLFVLLSVMSSIGFFSYCGIAGTLIIFEVIPFLVLAVGVDNIFIIVQHFEHMKDENYPSIDIRLATTISRIGPSILLTASSESIAFLLGALTPMPAVQIFSLYAFMAVLIDFLLQITCFVSVLALDARRQDSNRPDLCCCVPVSSTLPTDNPNEPKSKGILQQIFTKVWTPLVLGNTYVRALIFSIFITITCLSLSIIHRIPIGLDQKLSMPKDSYVLDYFYGLENYLSVGPPVYFVVNQDAIDYKNIREQDLLCGTSGCYSTSLLGQIGEALRQPKLYYLAQPPSSWLDDYFDWLQSTNDPPCCRINNQTHEFCPATLNDTLCLKCPITFQDNQRPSPDDFQRYIQYFLIDNPGEKCPKGGHAAYHDAVELINRTEVKTSYFMGFHSVLKTSKDFISAMRSANEIAKNISKTILNNQTRPYHDSNKLEDYPVFPYSVFYVFYDQYLTIWRDLIVNLIYSFTAVFLVTCILLGFDFHTAFLILLCVFMIIIDMFGVMYLWHIELNAVSVVNIVMSVGIAVEFCAHIARYFAVQSGETRLIRARIALAEMGSSVFSGITLTKIGGVVVLAFAKSQLFQVFYFRMYFALVIVGAMHGLLFLPILLSYFGPQSLEFYDEEKLARQVSATNTSLSSGININDDEGDICDSSRKL
ncbi:unnamed protein product [Adineta ricciae]|uniref:SSD domain-containing protein n=1 Tax=Adineta ricciae TaxID=249248 RepID=A0A814GLV8_ADIRI|nr:unnamed protein product [Adineta ricciae]